MARAWTENGPIALPSRLIAYSAAAALVLCAFVGAGLGLEASWRKAPGLDVDAGASTGGKDDAVIAKPIVDMAPPAAAPEAAKNQAASDDDDDQADNLAEQTAAAQAIQAKAAKTGGDIDDVLASPTEKPPAPIKAPADESAPGSPVKSDVPF
jgi:hypothetical protein